MFRWVYSSDYKYTAPELKRKAESRGLSFSMLSPNEIWVSGNGRLDKFVNLVWDKADREERALAELDEPVDNGTGVFDQYGEIQAAI